MLDEEVLELPDEEEERDEEEQEEEEQEEEEQDDEQAQKVPPKGCKRKASQASSQGPKGKATKGKGKGKGRLAKQLKAGSTKAAETKGKTAAKAESPSKASASGGAAGDTDQMMMDLMPEWSDAPECCKCRQRVDPLRMRVLGKRRGVWQCRTCSTRYTQLHRQWGGWPPKEFEGLTADEKARFWQSLGTADTAHEQQKVVLQALSQKVIESRIAGARGEYLPLGAYAARGFDVNLIEAKCTDKKEHPILGTTYRVDIDYQDKKQEAQRVREELLKSVQERREGGKGNGGKGKGSAGSAGKATAKAKNQPPEVNKATKRMQGDAVKIMAKVSPIAFSIQSTLKHKKIGLLPEPHIAKIKAALTDLCAMEKCAQKCIEKQQPLELTLREVSDKAQHATAINASLNMLLNTF